MTERWSVGRVTALSPDSASDVAGRRLANPTPWSDTGWEPPLLWGSCRGSGKTPYRVSVDTSGPTYACTCPSRKFPCKHVLALLYLWAEGRLGAAGAVEGRHPDTAWRPPAEPPGERTAPPGQAATDEQRAAAAKRAAQRDERVRSGMAELDRWLADQVTAGLASTATGGYPAAVKMAARMVDAQAPVVATRLREAALTVAGGRDWPDRLVDQFGLLHLLARASDHLDSYSEPLRLTVRQRLGYQTARAEVASTDPVADKWAVVGLRDSDEEQVSARRVWLYGLTTGFGALVLSFTPPGQQADNSLLPGMVVEADLHFYPGRLRLRALLGRRGAESGMAGWEPRDASVADATAQWREAVAADPWVDAIPGLVVGVPVAPRLGGTGRHRWALADTHGEALALVGTEPDLWQLLAITGGSPHPVFGELSEQGLRPTSVFVGGLLVPL